MILAPHHSTISWDIQQHHRPQLADLQTASVDPQRHRPDRCKETEMVTGVEGATM
jgi:hypothetical protein